MGRNGLGGRTQRYKCKDCGRRFDGGIRRDKSQVITDYVEDKQTLEQLAIKYGINEKTIRRDLEGMSHVYKIAKYKDVTVQVDTTYWGRNFGLMVIGDALRGNVLWHRDVHHKTIAQYVECFEWLKSKGFGIYGVVTEGMKGLPPPSILTQDPDIEASKKLLDLVDIITKTDKESFAVAFNGWYEKYKDVINERVRDKQNVKYLLICARDCEVRI